MHLPENSGEMSHFSASFQHFRKLLELNNSVLEKINEMERALAGEYVFDKSFLSSIVAELNEIVREIIYCLNALTEDRYLHLYGVYEKIAARLSELASQFRGPYDRYFVLSHELINADLDELTGSKCALLGELSNHLKIRTPAGFAVTVHAYNHFMETNGLHDKITSVLAESGINTASCERIRAFFDAAIVPQGMAEEIEKGLKKLIKSKSSGITLAVRSSAVGEDGRDKSFAGQFDSMLQVPPDINSVINAYKEVLASRFSLRALNYLAEVSSLEFPMAVTIQEMIQAEVSGVLYTRDPENPQSQELLITLVPGLPADLVSGKITPDRLLVSRTPPFALCTSEIFFREHSLPSNHDPIAITANGLRRGSSLLSREQIQQLTEIALLLEKAFGEPQDIEWAFDDHLAILQTRPLSLPEIPLPLPEELLKKISESQVLLEGRGFVAQLGVASGRVRHVDLNTDATNFPTGDIAVTKFPSPELSQIVLKAQAIITDVGGPTGHLATIAREYRTPALFGTEKASLILHDGDEITLDVENKKIYKGFIPELVAMQAQWVNAYRATPELKILRRILHWVAHLHLTDPTAESFTPENCESFHDIIRFCHEKAIDSLIRNYSTKSNLKGLSVHLLETSIPFKLSIIDLGGGIDQDSQKWHEVPSRAILSIPLQSLLDGLHSEEFWNQAMVSPGIKNILASMTKPISMLTNAPVYSGQNLAIISGNYCNVSLRLGYHFNVIDAYCSDMTDENYIYFRFAGGFADNVKKERRARLLARILRGLYFKVNRDKDLVIGKARSLDLLQMRAVLRRLGELIGFSRQLDVQMRHEEKVDELLEKFFSAPESEFRPMDR